MPTSLVTGGCGFIGSHVARHLRSMGHTVIAFDNMSGGSYEAVPHGENLTYGDIRNVDDVEAVFNTWDIDYVFHLAAYAAEGLSHYIRHYNYEVNVLGSMNLINAAIKHNVKRFVFTSSAAVYGHCESASEWDEKRPLDPYGIAKWAVEQDLNAAWSQFGLPYTIFRPHNVYGPGQNINDPYRNVVGIFMKQCLTGKPMTIYGDGMQTRQFTYIDDVAPYIASCIDMDSTKNIAMNIGSDASYRVSEIMRAVGKACGVQLQYQFHPERNEAAHVGLDHSLFKKHFQPSKPVRLEDGLQLMVEWAKQQPMVPSKPFADIEIEKGLPDIWKNLYTTG